MSSCLFYSFIFPFNERSNTTTTLILKASGSVIIVTRQRRRRRRRTRTRSSPGPGCGSGCGPGCGPSCGSGCVVVWSSQKQSLRVKQCPGVGAGPDGDGVLLRGGDRRQRDGGSEYHNMLTC